MVSWGPDLVTLGTIWLLRAKFGQLLSFFDCSGPR